MNEPKKKVDDPVLNEIDELMDFDEPEEDETKKEEEEKEPSEEASSDNEENDDDGEEKKEDDPPKEEEKKESVEEKTDNEADDDESDDEVLAQLNALAKENRELRTGSFDRTEVTKPAVKEEPKEEPKPPADIPKGKLIFNNQDEYEKALGSFEDFNKVLLQNQSAVFEMVAQKLIPVIGKMIEDYIKNYSAVEKFYSEQNDLTPVKDLVELEADKIRAKEPNLDTQAVLKKAGENARKIVGGYLKRSGKPSVKSAKPRLITPNGRASRPTKTTSPDPNSQEALMSDLL